MDGQPVAVTLTPALPVILTVGFERLNSRQYLKAWAYVLNKSDQAVELIPQGQLTVDVLDDSGMVFRTLKPLTPSTILKDINNAKHSAQAGALFAGILSGLASAVTTRNTEISSVGNAQVTGQVGNASVHSSANVSSGTVIHDGADKLVERLARNGDRVRSALGAIESAYESMKSSASSAMLRRNTLDDGASANGYVWFDYPRIEHYYYEKSVIHDGEPEYWRYRVSLSIPGVPPVSVVFVPTPGE